MASEDQRIEGLLDRARGGDRDALIGLLEANAGRVRARIGPKISPHLRSSIDEDDVMQVTYLEVVTRLDTFHGGGASGFLAWMSRLAENNLIDAIRMLEADKRPNPKHRVGARATPADDSSAYALIDLIGVTVTTPSKNMAANEIREALSHVLAQLPPDYATVIRLYDLQGKSASEVAAELNRSEGAIYMLRARAHDRLRDLLPGESRFFSVGG
ncbi:MAG: sigma-70 family RNA polymerase sigma factor [Phycisphaerales bacterium]|nr:sigma-70 family RNA polymerase sigma factor [Phycisphaerales bacterium]